MSGINADKMEELAFAASKGETGKRDFNVDRAWLVEYTRLVEQSTREQIAQEWDGCRCDVAMEGEVDVGASIRAGRLIDASRG